ncbi:hypothetical protein NUH87_28825 [Pseudomonas batumici]|uniref:hypothetical protein n=1 Tax=Pseudomonas batumici TaxID=226910 RepID=UPI0030CF175D
MEAKGLFVRNLLVQAVSLIVLTVFLAGCSSHKAADPAEPVEKPEVLTADEHNAKVIFKVVNTGATVNFKIGKPGNLNRVGVVYNDALEQQLPAFARGLAKGLTRGLYGAKPSREMLVPAGQLTEVEGVANWRDDRGTTYRLEKCGPLSRAFLAQSSKTYLVEFDLQNFLSCDQKIFDITQAGQKDQVSPAKR